jgi:hypothetical protein
MEVESGAPPGWRGAAAQGREEVTPRALLFCIQHASVVYDLGFRIWACVVFTYYLKLYHSFFSVCLDLDIFCFNQILNSTIVG